MNKWNAGDVECVEKDPEYEPFSAGFAYGMTVGVGAMSAIGLAIFVVLKAFGG